MNFDVKEIDQSLPSFRAFVDLSAGKLSRPISKIKTLISLKYRHRRRLGKSYHPNCQRHKSREFLLHPCVSNLEVISEKVFLRFCLLSVLAISIILILFMFFLKLTADGVTYTLGIFYVEFLDYFKSGKAETSWIASILVGVTLCSGN